MTVRPLSSIIEPLGARKPRKRKPLTPEQREKHRIDGRRWVEENREKARERARLAHKGRKRKRDLVRHRAGAKLRNEVQAGRIIRPKTCSQCGMEGIIHGHHIDYSKPLDVMWLCSICHGKQHRIELLALVKGEGK